MSLTNPNTPVSQQDLIDFYQNMYPNIAESQEEFKDFYDGLFPDMAEASSEELEALRSFYNNTVPYIGGNQVETLPTASVDNLGEISQYVGDTDASYTNGYFYKCVSDGQANPTYSWERTNVQPAGGGGSSATVLTQTLAAGSTTVTFTSIPTSGNYLIDFFASNGINYTAIDTSTAGQVTLTYKAQQSTVTVYCRIEEVE